MDRDAKIAEAQRLRADGLTYQKIGETLGVSGETARLLCNPAVREFKRKQESTPEAVERRRQRQSTPEYRERMRQWRTGPAGREWRRAYNSIVQNRCRAALCNSQLDAVRHGYLPCNATVEQLVEAFDGHCHCCGAVENPNARLRMDHCHDTGTFRGWLCNSCNAGIGMLRDIPTDALNYLRPDLATMLLQSFV